MNEEIKKEFEKEIWKLREANRNAISFLATCLDNCGTMDIEIILEMEDVWDGAFDRAADLAKDIGEKLCFEHFVMAWKEFAIEGAEEELTEKQIDALQDMIMDGNYCAWGCVASYGEGMEEESQNLFASYVRSGTERDRQGFVNSLKEEEDE